MTHLRAELRSEAGAGRRWSTRTAFFIAGLAGAVWAALVPYAKARAGISDGSLGLLLLCLGLGSMVAMPLAGALVPRLGCRVPITVAALVLAALLPLLAWVSAPFALVAALLAFGGALGSLDVVMNVQAIVVERASGRALMSGFHSMFSLGGIAGAGGMAALLSLGASPLAAALLMAAGSAAAILAALPHLLPVGGRAGGPAFALPHGIVLLIGALCFACFLAEGAILDWSAVMLTAERDMAATYAGIGYAAFAAAMTAGRLTGDRIVVRFGGSRVVLLSGLVAAAGFAVAALVPFWQATVLGYLLIGAGCSNIVPVLFTAVGRQRVMPENLAVPAITTVGYAGILLGPAAIGFIAQAASLAVAFLVIAAMLVGVAASGGKLRRLVDRGA